MKEKVLQIGEILGDLAKLRQSLRDELSESLSHHKAGVKTGLTDKTKIVNNSFVVSYYPALDLPQKLGAIEEISTEGDEPIVFLLSPKINGDLERRGVVLDNIIDIEKVARFVEKYSA